MEELRLIEFYFPVSPSSPLQEFSDLDMENFNSSCLKGIIQNEFYIPTSFVEISTNIRITEIKMKEKSCSGNSTVTSSGGHLHQPQVPVRQSACVQLNQALQLLSQILSVPGECGRELKRVQKGGTEK